LYGFSEHMIESSTKTRIEILCSAIVEGMQENKAQEIVVLDLRDIENTVSDFFVICTGESSAQVDGIADSVVCFTCKELQDKPWHVEGKGKSEWVLMDYVNVVAHIFYKGVRSKYDLEGLWSDAKIIEIPN
jgi:ribosome-associated protein